MMPDLNDGDNSSNDQVKASAVDQEVASPVESTHNTLPSDQLGEPKSNELAPEVVELSETAPQSTPDQASIEPIGSSKSPTAVESVESTQPPTDLNGARSSVDPVKATEAKSEAEQHHPEELLQTLTQTSDKPAVISVQEKSPDAKSENTNLSADPVSTAELANSEVETQSQNENFPSGYNDAVDHEDVELAASESVPVNPTGFLESLTANFAPDTKAMWAQIFGPRYEDEEEDDLQDDNQSNADSSRTSVSSKSSLQAKLARERKLDEQIQASQRRYRERVLRNAATNNNTATRRSRPKTSRLSQTQAPTISPLERAGLSLTQVRFCTEKALDETCKCFRHLHAAALEEPEDLTNPPTQGIYITQGELEQLLRELLDPQESTSNARRRKGTLAIPLDFAQNGGVGFVEGISMNTQLQASWFTPFGQLPQLRSLIMKITKRHLNEENLAIVNRHLQKQFTLLPLSTRLQTLVLQLSNHHLKEPLKPPMWPQGTKSSDELAQDLLECIAVNEGAISSESEDYKNFLLFLPVELIAKTQLSSVVSAQRLVFFRFLIDIIGAERMRLHSKSTESLTPPLLDQPPVKRKPSAGKRRSSSKRISRVSESEADPPAKDVDKPAKEEETTSVHGSLSSPAEASEVNETLAESDPFEQSSMAEQVGDKCEKPVSLLQQQLESAIAQLRQTLPTIDSDTDSDTKINALNPAIRATYLAAVACHQSVLLMLENNIDVDTAMSDKLKHFIEALQAIQIQTNDQAFLAPASPQLMTEKHQVLLDPPRFPPPYPKSTVAEEDDYESENGFTQTHFPPPYAITSPSYWTFTPSIPEPKSSIAKLANKSPSNKFTNLRSQFMSNESPGVGTYNIQQSEKLTYQKRPSYSFGLTGGGSYNKPSGSTLATSPLKCSTRKPNSKSSSRQRMRTSLAFVPPTLHPPEDNESQMDASTRVQYIDSHPGTSSIDDLLHDPPHYNEGDANEPPDESEDVETDPDESEDVETEMDRALRLQQRIFMDEFVQNVVSNQDSSPHFVPRAKNNTDKAQRSKSKPYWATSEVSPGIEKLLHRQRRAPKFRPSATTPVPSSTQPRTTQTARNRPPSPPPRRQLDNDQHLAWAARISELYQPTVSE